MSFLTALDICSFANPIAWRMKSRPCRQQRLHVYTCIARHLHQFAPLFNCSQSLRKQCRDASFWFWYMATQWYFIAANKSVRNARQGRLYTFVDIAVVMTGILHSTTRRRPSHLHSQLLFWQTTRLVMTNNFQVD
jgi:hypothetical protein